MLVELLQQRTQLSSKQLHYYAESASKRYKVYQIPKKTGGLRTIEHPSRPLKAIQRWLNIVLINHFPVHSCATAYAKKSNIRTNALRHVNTCFTVRLDFSSFFPSFKLAGIRAFLESSSERCGIELSVEDIQFVSGIVCRNGALTIGAPTSPMLTNAMMFDFDSQLFAWANNKSLIYTRYADDMFISSTIPNSLGTVESVVKELAGAVPFATLSLNEDKTVFLSRKYRRTITGLTITPDQKVSIGRARKREMKSCIYKSTLGKLDEEQTAKTAGMLAFAKDVEPAYFDSLARKFGHQVLNGLLGIK